MSNFKQGDVVELKSGGLAMTVLNAKDGEVVCQWFDENDQLKTYPFNESVLRKVAEQESSG